MQGERLGVGGCGATRVHEEVLEVVALALGGAETREAWCCERAEGVRPGKRFHVVSTLAMVMVEGSEQRRRGHSYLGRFHVTYFGPGSHTSKQVQFVAVEICTTYSAVTQYFGVQALQKPGSGYMLPQEASRTRTRVRERKRMTMQIRSMRLEYLRLGCADERISRYMRLP